MRKVLVFVKQHIGTICLYLSIASLFALFGGGWWDLLPAATMALQAYLIRFVLHATYKAPDNAYWSPPAAAIQAIAPQVFERLASQGYAKEDYRAEVNDCDDYTLAGIVAAHDLLLEMFPDTASAFSIFPFSFRRVNGKRHRLFFVTDDEGNRHYIENYPVFDKYHDASGMFRLLSAGEEFNGHIPS